MPRFLIDFFATARLSAARLVPDDLPLLRGMHHDPRVMATLGGVRTEAETLAYLARNLEHWELHQHGL